MKTITGKSVFSLCTLGLLMLVGGCGGDKQTTRTDWGDRPRLEYSFPYHGQPEVSTRAPVVLRFSHPLTDTAPEDEVQWLDADDQPVPFTATMTADGRSLVLTPSAPLRPVSDYRIELGELGSEGRTARVPDAPIDFRTRGLPVGPRDFRALPGAFEITRMIPDGEHQPVMDFSSFRLQFSQPLDRDSVSYGVGEALALLDSNDDLVPARVLIQGSYLTLDPVDDLTPGGSYTLTSNGGLESLYGESLAPFSMALTARDSAPRETLVKRAADSEGGTILSPLTGMPINNVPVNARLLGDQSSSQQQGDVHAELAYIPNFPDVSPLRVPRGALLEGSSVEVSVAGEVPAGFSTGDIEVRFISDAMGYLIENPYTSAAESPRHVRLFMDIAMTAENPEANGALSQDLLHVELAGTAFVEEGQLVINAVGLVEPRVLGLEQAWGVLSFRLASYHDQLNAPDPVEDTVAPTLQSWVPGDYAASARPGDPVILNFTEALDPASIEGAVTVTRDGTAVDASWRLDGASVVLEPQGGLQFGSSYTITLSDQITDTAGNALSPQSLSFDMADYHGAGNRSPIALTTYPGYPCAMQDPNLDGSPSEHQGRCRGGRAGDDRFPVERVPAERAISVQFSQNMSASSIVLGESCGSGTFRVERLNAAGTCINAVPGQLEVSPRGLSFSPDSPWEEGELYRYVLASNRDAVAADCGTLAICSTFNYPLQTELLRGAGASAGGRDMVNHFRGGAATGDVFQQLVNLPTSDTNANFAIDPGEANPQPDPDNPGFYIVPDNAAELRVHNTSGLLLDANVGCGFTGGGYSPGKETCNDKKFLYITGGLTADVGEYDPVEEAVRVDIRPTLIMTTSIDVHAVLFLLVPSQTVIPTGPQVMRMRYEDNGAGQRNQPITGWLYETPDGPRLRATLQLYLDAPNLAPEVIGITLTHDLYSYPLTLNVDGPVSFLPDGRMVIQQTNIGGPADIQASISLLSFGAAGMTLRIPENGLDLTFLARPVK
ncbi:Ig-like domain-containing protein [Alcanivorax sp. JB21]|uniref:Ig-like domain-containing protein n=1 Tax=Alcanivorax limicola TaxID=2874102 RepID=UPI001CBF41C4|nr:Ig-like domain-containing protein [Alcanivorax limicola]MBZ2189164.1 Ig-like domain-containing protein [Alcanivorax limicola]